MYTHLGDAKLTNGETLGCGVVTGPDAEWAPRIRPYLAHKQPKWRAHIDVALDRPLDALETRFYVGTLAGAPTRIVTLVMVAGAARPAGRVGLLGYVFTAPEQRGKGAYSALMTHQMDDCRRAGFVILTLTTARDSTAWRIYQRFGFVPDHPETSGRMRWLADPDAEVRWFAPTPITLHPMAWDDWPALNLTATRVPAPDEDEEPPRSWLFHLPSHNTAEGTFSDVLPEWAALIKKRPRERASYAATLRSETGAVAGWLAAAPDRLTMSAAQQVDLYLHPAFVDRGGPLLIPALSQLPGPLTAYVTRPDGYRARVLRSAGFSDAGMLDGWLGDHPLLALKRA
ncbi:MAG TPA: GNAT family N-acetyltransferase [Chloroflexota bacterium]|nr:GNAT family N-acetyltransferase [Chloroflexota bacterium]